MSADTVETIGYVLAVWCGLSALAGGILARIGHALKKPRRSPR